MELAVIERLLAEGRAAEALGQIEKALAGDLAPGGRFDLEMKAGDALAMELADPMGGLSHYGEALAVANEHGLAGRYRAELGIGRTLSEQGRSQQALLYLEMAAGGAGEAGDHLNAAVALSLQGNILIEMGEYDQAALIMAKVDQVAAAGGALALRAQAVATLALLNAYMEQYAKAEELGRDAMALAKETGDVGLVAIVYLRMGQIMYQQDRFGPAYYWFKAGGDVAREAGLDALIKIFDEAVEATGVKPEPHHDHDDHDGDQENQH